MKVGTSTVGTNLLNISTKKVLQSKPARPARAHGWQNMNTMSSHSHISATEEQLLVLRGVQAAQRWSKGRAARIEELRMQVQADTYKVDSTTLAEHMLVNRTLFLDLENDGD